MTQFTEVAASNQVALVDGHIGEPATAAKIVETALSHIHPLKLLKPPVEIPGFTMCRAWHEIHRTDAKHRWLREVILETAKG